MKKIIYLIFGFLLFSTPNLAYADWPYFTAINIQYTQAQISGSCDDGVQCDPNSPLSYVLDLNTLEQRDVLTWVDEGYNLSTVTWAVPLEDDHTYRIRMHSDVSGFDQFSQDFLFVAPDPPTPTPTESPTPTPTPTPIEPPTNKAQCKKGGWEVFNFLFFKNQGDCINYVN